MKRCPECRRDYLDDTLLYCLEDGAALVQGSVPVPVGEADEPPTAILHDTAPSKEAATRVQIPMTGRTAVQPASTGDMVPKRVGFDKRLLAPPLLLAIIFLGGFFGYRYFASGKQIESIAVMPFVNEGGNSDVEYLSDGMTETLIGSLSQMPNVSVKARSSVFRYKGKETDAKTIGSDLNVQAVLFGHVTQHGSQLKLSLELIDARTDNVIWSEQYNREQSDLVSLQSEIARDVSSKLKTKLSPADEQKVTKSYTADPKAYHLYLKGRFYWEQRTGESLKRSVEYFNQAIAQDPNYALAYSGLADAFQLIPSYEAGSPKDYSEKAKAAAMKALALDETLAEAHASLGLVLWGYDWNFAEANRQFQRAIELNPNYASAHQWKGENLVMMGRFDDGIAELKRSLELDPLSLIINADLGEAYTWARQYDKAIEQLRKTVEMDQGFYYAHWQLGIAYELNGSYPQAIAEYKKARELNDDPFVLATLVHAYAGSGDHNEALRMLDQLKVMAMQQYVGEYSFAVAYAGVGEREKAFEFLSKGCQNRTNHLNWIKVDPLLDNLRSDPRFADLLKCVGLP